MKCFRGFNPTKSADQPKPVKIGLEVARALADLTRLSGIVIPSGVSGFHALADVVMKLSGNDIGSMSPRDFFVSNLDAIKLHLKQNKKVSPKPKSSTAHLAGKKTAKKHKPKIFKATKPDHRRSLPAVVTHRQPTEQSVKSFIDSHSQVDPASDAFLQSFEWRSVRMMALKKYKPVCMCCGASPATGAVMNVDHVKPRKIFPDLALDISNLQILCNACNHGKGNWDMTDWRQEKEAA